MPPEEALRTSEESAVKPAAEAAWVPFPKELVWEQEQEDVNRCTWEETAAGVWMELLRPLRGSGCDTSLSIGTVHTRDRRPGSAFPSSDRTSPSSASHRVFQWSSDTLSRDVTGNSRSLTGPYPLDPTALAPAFVLGTGPAGS